MTNIMPEEENIIINEFYELLTINLNLLQGKDLSDLKSTLKTVATNPSQFADVILDWCNQSGINLSQALRAARCDLIEADQPVPELPPVTQNQIMQNIFKLLEQAEETPPPESTTNQTTNDQ
jgi:hypothetical protein